MRQGAGVLKNPLHPRRVPVEPVNGSAQNLVHGHAEFLLDLLLDILQRFQCPLIGVDECEPGIGHEDVGADVVQGIEEPRRGLLERIRGVAVSKKFENLENPG